MEDGGATGTYGVGKMPSGKEGVGSEGTFIVCLGMPRDNLEKNDHK